MTFDAGLEDFDLTFCSVNWGRPVDRQNFCALTAPRSSIGSPTMLRCGRGTLTDRRLNRGSRCASGPHAAGRDRRSSSMATSARCAHRGAARPMVMFSAPPMDGFYTRSGADLGQRGPAGTFTSTTGPMTMREPDRCIIADSFA